jgi:dihydroflavonol-4-reductase
MLTVVTGASGHVGANLVRELLAQKRKVRCLVREDTRALKGLKVEMLKGDVRDPESIMNLLKGADIVFHCAAKISIVGSQNGLVEETNIQGVKNVVEACLKNRIKRLVHVSSIHAFNNKPKNEVIDENRPLTLEDHHLSYDKSKAKGQMAVLEGVKRGLNAVIVNPGGIIGPNDFKLSRMGSVILDLYHGRLPALVDSGYNWVDVRDVVSGILAAEKKGRKGESYLLTGHWGHMIELGSLITKLTGKKTPKMMTPVWLAHLVSYFSLAAGRLQNEIPKFTPEAMKSIKKHRFISHQKATDELGYNHRPFEETLRDTLAWFDKMGMLKK